jgi:hypothetical protein
MVIQMRSRKILVAVLAGLLLITVVGPVVTLCEGDTSTQGIKDCTPLDWLKWLIEMMNWIMSGRPDGGPPIPECL